MGDLNTRPTHSSHYDFRRHPNGLCALDFLFTILTEVRLGTHRKVSTPSPFGAWLGIAILQVSPNLMSFHLKVSQKGRNIKLRMRRSTN